MEHDLHLRLSHGRGWRDARAGVRSLADGIEYVRAAVASGQDVDDFAPRLAFFFVARTTLLEEIAKFRAARRIWAQVMRDEFGARNPKSQMLRFHTQTAGVQLTAQQPEVNLVRVALQGLARSSAARSRCTRMRTTRRSHCRRRRPRVSPYAQQVLAYETDVTATVDPFAGSYAVESMTDDIEAATRDLMRQVEELGGAVAAIERGFQKTEIERSAYRVAQEIDAGQRVVVGLNRFTVDIEEPYEPLRVDPAIEEQQRRRLATLRGERSATDVDRALTDLQKAAEGSDNVLYPMHDALRAAPPSGGVHALRQVWGVYVPPDASSAGRAGGRLSAGEGLVGARRSNAAPMRKDQEEVMTLSPTRISADVTMEHLLDELPSLAKSYEDELVALRRDLHAHPELGRTEIRTTGIVRERLLAAGLEPRDLTIPTGLVCDVGDGDRAVALRTDIDALAVVDEKDVAYRSTVIGVCHACGRRSHRDRARRRSGARRPAPGGPAARPGAADLPAGRGDHAGRRARRDRLRRTDRCRPHLRRHATRGSTPGWSG